MRQAPELPRILIKTRIKNNLCFMAMAQYSSTLKQVKKGLPCIFFCKGI